MFRTSPEGVVSRQHYAAPEAVGGGEQALGRLGGQVLILIVGTSVR